MLLFLTNQEPVETWTKMKNDNGESLLEAFYKGIRLSCGIQYLSFQQSPQLLFNASVINLKVVQKLYGISMSDTISIILHYITF